MHSLLAITVEYLSDIRTQRAQFNSTGELSHRDALGEFLRARQALGKSGTFTGEPKKDPRLGGLIIPSRAV